MACHAVRFKCSTEQASNPSHVPQPEPPSLPSVVPERVSLHVLDKFSEVLPGQAQAASVLNTSLDGDGVGYVQGVRRFSDADDLQGIVDEIVGSVVADAEWYVVESHVCDHDEDERTGCGGWVVEQSNGDVPAEVQ